MSDQTPRKSEREVLPELVATRVLARAIELDQARVSGSTVADLRAVADEVGVSAGAFDAALAELGNSENAPVPVAPRQAKRRLRISALTAFVAAFVATGALYVFMRTIPNQAAVSVTPMVEEAILLRCLSPNEAVELIRLELGPSVKNVTFRMREASRMLTVRATAEQLQKVKSLIDEQQAPGSAACATRPVPPGTR